MSSSSDIVTTMSDIWSLLYYHLAQGLTSMGPQGEAALRRGIRKYGRERGLSLRARHLGEGKPINLLSLFGNYDFPEDPRFLRNKIELTEQTRLSETLVCPCANVWLSQPDGARLGRIYCEEVHHAIFAGYEPAIQTNLSQTITQGDPKCRFSVYLRPANQLASEHVVQKYVALAPGEETMVTQTVDVMGLLYLHIAREYASTFGAEGIDALKGAVRAFGAHRGRRLREYHQEHGIEISVTSLVNNPDQPQHNGTDVVGVQAGSDSASYDVTKCRLFDGWKARGGADVAAIYCKEMYPAMFDAYEPGIRLTQPLLLCGGDDRCSFQISTAVTA